MTYTNNDSRVRKPRKITITPKAVQFMRELIENPPQIDRAKLAAELAKHWPGIMRTNAFLGLPVYRLRKPRK